MQQDESLPALSAHGIGIAMRTDWRQLLWVIFPRGDCVGYTLGQLTHLLRCRYFPPCATNRPEHLQQSTCAGGGSAFPVLRRGSACHQETLWTTYPYREVANLTPKKTSAVPVMKSR